MASLSTVFTRISGGSSTVSTSDAQKAALKAGNFGVFSVTGKMMKGAIEKAMSKADANQDGQLDVNEFRVAVAGIAGKLPAWDAFAAGKTELVLADIAQLVTEAAKRAGGAIGGLVDSDGVARVTMSLLDDDGNGSVSQAEYGQLRTEASAG